MSIEISQRVWKSSKQYGSNKLVLLVLADHANSDGYCYPGIERIAEWAQVEDRQARRIIREIEAHGELYIHTGGGRNGTNQYLITVAMDRTDIVNALVRYFKVERTQAEGTADTILAVRAIENPKPSRRTKNPVTQDEGGREDRENNETLSCETPPPVMQDQNPVMQRGNPVLDDSRTVINPQLTSNEPLLGDAFKTQIQTHLRSTFHIPPDDSGDWLDALCAEIPDETFLTEQIDRTRAMQSHTVFDRVAFVRTTRHRYLRSNRAAIGK